MTKWSVAREVFRNAYQRCTRAGAQVRELESEVSTFLAATPFTIVPDPSGAKLRVRVGTEPPEQWGLLIGEVAYQLRAALDNAVYDLASLATRHPSSGASFLICRNKKSFRQRAKTALADLNPTPRTAIRKVQPYHRAKRDGVPLTRQPLLLLDSLLRRDAKYPARLSGALMRDTNGTQADDRRKFEIVFGPFKDGDIVAKGAEVAALSSEAWPFAVVFRDGAAHGHPIVATLDTILETVSKDVLPKLTAAIE